MYHGPPSSESEQRSFLLFFLVLPYKIFLVLPYKRNIILVFAADSHCSLGVTAIGPTSQPRYFSGAFVFIKVFNQLLFSYKYCNI
jgi:hypothetical protein